MKSLLLGCMLGIGAISAAPMTQAATLMNGSFEEPCDTACQNEEYTFDFITLDAGSPELTGWTIESGSIDRINVYWQASAGRFSLDMSGNSAGAISQSITDLTIGRSYRVSFDMAGNPDGGPAVKTLGVSVGGASADYTFDVTGKTRTAMGYKTHFLSFTATSTSALLTFTSKTDGFWGPALDNVSVAEVPLPAGAPLLAAALAGLVLARHRRA